MEQQKQLKITFNYPVSKMWCTKYYYWLFTVIYHSTKSYIIIVPWLIPIIDGLRFYVPWFKIGHFTDVLPSQSLGLVLKNYKNTTRANMYP